MYIYIYICEPFSVQISNFAYCMIGIIEPDLSPFEYQEKVRMVAEQRRR